MTYEEKLELILQALSEAQKFTRKGYFTKLYFTRDNGLKDINLNEIHDILLKIQDEEKVITVKEIPSKIKSNLEFDIDKVEYFLIDTPEEFSLWYEAHIFENMHKIENMDWINLLKIYDVALDINQQLQIAGSNTVFIPSLPHMVRFPLLFPQDSIGTRRTYQDYRMEGADFLSKRGGVLEYKYIDSMDFGYGEVKIVVDLINFRDFLLRIGNEYKRRNEKYEKTQKEPKVEKPVKKMADKPPEEEKKIDTVYEIFYSKQRQVLLNNIEIARPDFDSENELVFSFLMDNSNKKHTKAEIEKAVGKPLTKTLHKIVENLGFKGEIRQAFFDVSKDSICFRNPIRKEDLDKLGITKLKLPKQ